MVGWPCRCRGKPSLSPTANLSFNAKELGGAHHGYTVHLTSKVELRRAENHDTIYEHIPSADSHTMQEEIASAWNATWQRDPVGSCIADWPEIQPFTIRMEDCGTLPH